MINALAKPPIEIAEFK